LGFWPPELAGSALPPFSVGAVTALGALVSFGALVSLAALGSFDALVGMVTFRIAGSQSQLIMIRQS
jgi:hypothetical protein